MNRRGFLKTVLGTTAACTAYPVKLLGNARVFNPGSCSNDINFNNIKTTGTFNEWIESIRTEIERLLTRTNDNWDTYTVETTCCDWGYCNPGGHRKSIPAAAIAIKRNGQDVISCSFGRMEFDHKNFGKGDKKYLKSLVSVRFIDMLWSIEAMRECDFRLLRRFGPKHKTPDCCLH